MDLSEINTHLLGPSGGIFALGGIFGFVTGFKVAEKFIVPASMKRLEILELRYEDRIKKLETKMNEVQEKLDTEHDKRIEDWKHFAEHELGTKNLNDS